MLVTKTIKVAFGSSLFFQNSEHPKIGYFGQGRREPRVGPGTAQILRITILCSPKQARKMAHFSPDFQVIAKKKKVFKERFSVFHFDGPYEAHWALSWVPGSLSPLPPLSEALILTTTNLVLTG